MKPFRAQEAFRTLLVALMMACLAAAAGELALRFVPGFDPTPLTVLAFLVCLEGIATDRLARQLPDPSDRLKLHLMEWVMVLVVLRLVLTLSQGPAALEAAAARWVEQPQTLLDAGLAVAAALLFLTWSLGRLASRSLEALDPQIEVPPAQDSPAFYAWLTRPQVTHQTEGWEALTNLFLAGGVLILILSGLARLDLPAILSLQNPAIAGLVGNVLLYFLLGFTMLGQGQYAMLRARWERQAVPVAGRLGRRWAALGLAFALLVATAVLLLPVRPSLALFAAAFELVWAGLYLVVSVALMALTLASYLLGQVLQLLGLSMGGIGGDVPPMRRLALEPQPAQARAGWWEAIQGLLLWAIVLGVLGYALLRFVYQRRALWAQLAGLGGLLGWVVGLYQSLWSWMSRTEQGIRTRWRSWMRRPASNGSGGLARLSAPWRARTARERVLLLYFYALQQVGHLGWPRTPQDTPYEYARRVTDKLAEVSADLDCLTQAFVEAKYGRRQFAGSELGPIRAAYRRLRQVCRRVLARQP